MFLGFEPPAFEKTESTLYYEIVDPRQHIARLTYDGMLRVIATIKEFNWVAGI